MYEALTEHTALIGPFQPCLSLIYVGEVLNVSPCSRDLPSATCCTCHIDITDDKGPGPSEAPRPSLPRLLHRHSNPVYTEPDRKQTSYHLALLLQATPGFENVAPQPRGKNCTCSQSLFLATNTYFAEKIQVIAFLTVLYCDCMFS